ncbi:histidine--tRNA ligase [Candidatus Berkelbacteria bacterium CG10_big_fil_rev_8_21_14_0_10_43_13]|uniref:Histidine--tRNA ligase n=1 Tax=Candidatus Berkelbacteria bacterium CG10_big_fil_rev_8_21_14_0_10_43_13 TaxID=1974514 RepID=A0A2H0W689_9BACT|nr:MAG: histidine--tRNA ligase [Candidatus Berkelbacteria bacterium CG10_big_fil_rev_8_21_14_0_10_43_13]
MGKQVYQTARGTKDILPAEQPYWAQIKQVAEKTLLGLGFGRITLPHFEDADIYTKGIGADTDIVSKEMFYLKSHTDSDSVKLALRPEGTAGAVRSYIQNGMSSLSQPVRLYYTGAMFRHERPQKGRFREFYQVGVEIFGDDSAKADYLVIMSAWEILNRLGLKNLIVYANSIGCPKCRPKYIAKLKKYYKSHLDNLCTDCQNRYEVNPLRLLDCKEDSCQKVAKGAPTMLDNLCTDCKTHFQQTLEYLDYFNIRYDLDPTLVRGLDYYTRTVFEIVDKSDKGRKNTIVGGGRYDGLVELLGGHSTPAVGYSIGLERLVGAMKEQGIKPPKTRGVEVCILQLGDKAREISKKIYDTLAKSDINVYFVPSNDGIRPQIKSAAKIGATYAVIIGQKEALNDEIILRDLTSSSQEVFSSKDIAEEIKNRLIKCEC